MPLALHAHYFHVFFVGQRFYTLEMVFQPESLHPPSAKPTGAPGNTQLNAVGENHPVSVCPDTNWDRCRDGVGGCGARESKAKASRGSDYPSKNTSGTVAVVNKSYFNPPVHFLRWKYMRLNSSPQLLRGHIWLRSAKLPFSEEKSLRKES